MIYFQDIRRTFEELRSKLKQKPPEEEYEVLTGGGEHDAKDYTLLQLIQQLYQLSGDAKVNTIISEFYTVITNGEPRC